MKDIYTWGRAPHIRMYAVRVTRRGEIRTGTSMNDGRKGKMGGG